MTEVAAVSGHATAKAQAGTKGAGKGVDSGSVLDGAFAAMFGEADGAFAKLAGAGAGATTGKVALDPALAGQKTADGSALPDILSLSGETGDLEGESAIMTGKPRKGARKGRADATEDAPAQAFAALAAVPQDKLAVQGKVDAAKAGKNTPASAVGAQNPELAAEAAKADVEAQAQAAVAELAAGKDAELAQPVAAFAQAQTKAQQQAGATAGTGQAVAAPGQPAAETDLGGSSAGDGRERGQDGAPVPRGAALAANDDTLMPAADPLNSIIQSLPPVLQSQLNVSGAAGAASVASTGELLGNQVIDMSISGQWIDRMAREIAGLAEGTGHARFQLNPPNLGRIQVDLWQGDDKMNLRLLAETDEAARRLREGQNALETHARVQQLSLGSVSVEKASQTADSGKEQPNQRQNTDANGNPNQQGFAQAQGQSAQGRGNSNGNLNGRGSAAVIGSERQAETGADARATRADDPRVRFA